MLIDLIDSFYVPHYNCCTIGITNGIYIYSFFYLAGIAVIIYYLISSYLLKENTPSTQAKFKNFTHKALWGILITLIIFQTIAQIRFFTDELDFYHNRRISQRYPGRFQELVDFSLFCKSILPGKHTAQLITDLDFNKDFPGLFTTWVLGYFLYPIDIKNIREGEPKDCLIIFMKKDPYQNIPVDYKVIGKFNNHLLAIKK